MRRSLFLLLAAMLLLSAPAWSQAVTDRDRFELWNNCGSIDLIVERLSKNAPDIGLIEDTIATAIRSRLRAARLYDADASSYIYANVGVGNRSFTIGISYKKLVIDSASGELNFAVTWNTGGYGTHGKDSGYIMSFISRYVDKFIDEYLRINEDVCSR